MSTSWIKMRTALETSPQVIRIASALPLSADCPHAMRTACAVGCLHRTWALADTHTEDGRLIGYTPEALDAVIGIPGWSALLEAVGWLVVTPDGIEIPDFSDHNGASAKKRAKDAHRKAASRSVRNLSASKADKSVTREEKRREEKNKTDNARGRARGADAPVRRASPPDEPPEGGLWPGNPNPLIVEQLHKRFIAPLEQHALERPHLRKAKPRDLQRGIVQAVVRLCPYEPDNPSLLKQIAFDDAVTQKTRGHVRAWLSKIDSSAKDATAKAAFLVGCLQRGPCPGWELPRFGKQPTAEEASA